VKEHQENAKTEYVKLTFYGLVLRQSLIKQQSVFEHWPFERPKHGVYPSAIWMAWISSGFFIFPGFIPRDFAFVFISGIPKLFLATIVAGIFCLLIII
jgi:hypothetical protein